MKRFIAEIIDNNDPDQKGRVQIYIPHIMEGWDKSHYPWAFQDSSLTSFIPEIGDKVWIWFEEPEYFKKPFYQHKVNFHTSNDANKTIGSMAGAYPDIKYIYLPNGVAIALNSNTDQKELSITNGSSEIYINNDGAITVNNSNQDITIGNGKGEVKLASSGEVTVKNDQAEIKLDSTGNVTVTNQLDINITNGISAININPAGIITLQSGDATIWMPNILPNCPVINVPHGGPTAGIIKLKGG